MTKVITNHKRKERDLDPRLPAQKHEVQKEAPQQKKQRLITEYTIQDKKEPNEKPDLDTGRETGAPEDTSGDMAKINSMLVNQDLLEKANRTMKRMEREKLKTTRN